MINFDLGASSTSKGEELFDTLHTLEAMHLDAIIVRHKQSGTPDELVRHAMSGVSVINAGDGNHAHPTQGLLDALTIRQHRPDFENLKVVICGDIRHSRVARSDIHAFTALGVKEIRLCAPAELMPDTVEVPHGQRHHDFDQAIEGADAVLMLRLQKERMASIDLPDEAAYFAHYGLDQRRLARADHASRADQSRYRDCLRRGRWRPVAHPRTGRQRRLRADGRPERTARALNRPSAASPQEPDLANHPPRHRLCQAGIMAPAALTTSGITMRSTTRYLAMGLASVMLAACSHKDKDAPLAFVPADTPYVVANLEVMDDSTPMLRICCARCAPNSTARRSKVSPSPPDWT